MSYKEVIEWNEIKTRPLTEEEKERYDGEGVEYMFDCQMPDDNEEILVFTSLGIYTDICIRDGDSIYLERIGGWECIKAWAYMPKGEKVVDEEQEKTHCCRNCKNKGDLDPRVLKYFCRERLEYIGNIDCKCERWEQDEQID